MDFFSQEQLSKIFKEKTDSKDNIISSRENSILEFKQSFGWKTFPKYAKSMAAFANAKGGYIIFGVKDRPRQMIGLQEKHFSDFDNIDAKDITEQLNNIFAPEIEWEHTIYENKGMRFGLIYVLESQRKPIIAKINKDNDIREGDIFYRYRGRSERIKYPELKTIMDDSKESERQEWIKIFTTINNAGIKNVGILNLKTGITTNSIGQNFYIDEALIPKLKVITEGNFVEKDSAPAVKLIGNLEAVRPITLSSKKASIVREKGFGQHEIITDFLENRRVKNPIDYIEQISKSTTHFLPIYYYLYLSSKNINEVVSIVNLVKSEYPNTKKSLIERLKKFKTQSRSCSFNKKSDFGTLRNNIKNFITNEIAIEEYSEDNSARFFEVLLSIDKKEIISKKDFLFKEFKSSYNNSENFKNNVKTLMRKALCYLDECIYFNFTTNPIDNNNINEKK